MADFALIDAENGCINLTETLQASSTIKQTCHKWNTDNAKDQRRF